MSSYFSPRRLISLTILLGGLLFAGATACTEGREGPKTPVAVNGVLDMAGWDLARDGALKLDGQWEFCWGSLPVPSDFMKTGKRDDCGFIEVPGFWKDYRIGGAAFPGKGRATYRLTILGGPGRQPVTITAQRIYSDFRLWVNGEPVDQRLTGSGPHRSRKDYVFIHNSREWPFTLEEGKNELVLQVINERYESGGIGMSLLLEGREEAERKGVQHDTANMIIVGILLAVAMFNIVLYVFRRIETVTLNLGFFSLFFAINLYNIQTPIFTDALSRLGYPFLIDYLSIIPVTVLAMTTLRSLFPDDFAPSVIRVYAIAAAGFMFAYFVIDFIAYQRLIKSFYLLSVLLWFYSLYVFVRAIGNRRDDAALFFLSYIPLYLGGINDILYEMWIINTGKIAPYGMIVLCLSATLVISRRYSIALKTVQEQSKDLEEKNRSLQELDRLKDRFLANTTHELRTPLHGMIGLSESMIEGVAGSLPPKAIENISLIASNGHRLAGMVNDLLDMAKLQHEGLSLNLRPVDLGALGDMVVKLSLPLAGDKPLEIVNAIDADIPTVNADEERIRQVLYNLLGNAIKFTNEGTIVLSARVIDRETDDDDVSPMVEVRVADTGIGVPPEYRETIFQPYRQVHEGDTRSFSGTGLGLAIANQIVELHGGAIRVEPGEIEGSVFAFTLPVSPDPVTDKAEAVIIAGMDDTGPGEGAQFTAEAPRAGAFENNPVFLVVDDDPVNVKMLRDFFESRKCTVKTAADGIRALDLLDRDDSIDLVLLDIMMPGMSGYEVCRRIRINRPPGDLPVILLTARNRIADIDAAFAAGANDYVVKPFRISELTARVSTMLRLRNVRKSAARGITIRDRTRTYSLAFSDIIFITSHQKNVVIHTPGDDIEVPVMMKDIIHRLPPDLFVRIHKSHVINTRYIHSVSHVLSGRYRVRLRDEDDTELPVGPSYLASLRKKL